MTRPTYQTLSSRKPSRNRSAEEHESDAQPESVHRVRGGWGSWGGRGDYLGGGEQESSLSPGVPGRGGSPREHVGGGDMDRIEQGAEVEGDQLAQKAMAQ